MNHLLRDIAPISDAAWAELEDEAVRTLKAKLIARRVIDFEGPLGWEASAVNLGHVRRLDQAPGEGLTAMVREVLPLVEMRSDFRLSLRQLENIDRGAKDADLDPLIDAAIRLAYAEDHAVFHGYEAGGIHGMSEFLAERTLSIKDDYEEFPATVAEAVATLQQSGVAGPYAVLLGPRCFSGVMTGGGRSGYPIMERIKPVIDGPIYFAPAVDGSIVLSTRGGDFQLTVGQDISLGYAGHTADEVHLYLVESLAFQVFNHEAAVHLTYALG